MKLSKGTKVVHRSTGLSAKVIKDYGDCVEVRHHPGPDGVEVYARTMLRVGG